MTVSLTLRHEKSTSKISSTISSTTIAIYYVIECYLTGTFPAIHHLHCRLTHLKLKEQENFHLLFLRFSLIRQWNWKMRSLQEEEKKVWNAHFSDAFNEILFSCWHSHRFWKVLMWRKLKNDARHFSSFPFFTSLPFFPLTLSTFSCYRCKR